MPVNIRHSYPSCSRLSCDSSLRRRRRNFWVSYSLTRVPASTRRPTCLGGRRTNACMFGDTQNCVSKGFLPGVVWANLSLLILRHRIVVCCAVHGTPPFLCRPLRTTAPCRTVWFCIFCSRRLGRALHSTSQFSCLQLRKTVACRSRWLCTFCY